MATVYIRFGARSLDDLQRSPMLERLVARAARAAPVADWRAEAFAAIAPGAPLPSVGAALLRAAGGAAPLPRSWVCVATPVHLSAGMSSVTLPRDGILCLRPGEAQALASDFNRVFGGAEVRLSVSLPASAAAGAAGTRAAQLLCCFPQPRAVCTHDPEAAAGHDVFAFQPTGPAAPALRRLMSEMEMWLFEHAVNRARARDAEPPITGLWLWGGGSSDERVPAVRGFTAGADPLFAAFGDERQFPSAAGAGVVVAAEQPGSGGWSELEQRWLAPAAAALSAGQITCLKLSAAERCFSVGRRSRLRFWRRPQPWWESYGIQ
jgi:hypothetical protein